ncbi:MAG: hypothetical protein JNL02_09815 [Saprospiraceae bacterium]|nr:hypothetical protein [Saprospiraceae bacterium]
MKFLKISLLALFAISAAFFYSCDKEQEISTLQPSVADSRNSQQAIAARDAAFQKHNAYLDFICAKIASGELNPTKSPESVAQLKMLTKAFFNSSNNPDINTLIEESFNHYFSGQTSFPDNLAGDLSSIKSAMENYENQTISDFVNQTNQLMNQPDQILLDEGLASILGVAQGSYTYWFSITPESCYYASLPQAQGAQERACGEKCKKLLGFAAADLSGAADGAAIGTLLGGVGAGPGAVMGGAIGSGLAALQW